MSDSGILTYLSGVRVDMDGKIHDDLFSVLSVLLAIDDYSTFYKFPPIVIAFLGIIWGWHFNSFLRLDN